MIKTLTGKLFVISAPTGAGKTTIAQALLQQLAHRGLAKVTTYTTRQPRSGERSGNDYHFLSEEEFLQKKEIGFFLETTYYDGSWYGSPASVRHDLQHGKSFIMVTDRPGALVIKQLIPQAILIWITVPSPEVIAQRLQKRGTEDAARLAQRIAIATHEMAQEKEHPAFDYHVMNGDFETAVAEVIAIVK